LIDFALKRFDYKISEVIRWVEKDAKRREIWLSEIAIEVMDEEEWVGDGEKGTFGVFKEVFKGEIRIAVFN